MSRHPVTPMQESDLRLHLASQTDRPIALMDILSLQSPNPEAALVRQTLVCRGGALLFDGLDEPSLEVVGRLLWNSRPAPQTFAIGSSGLTHALIRYWRKAGIIPPEFTPPTASAVDRLIVMSGSCSPVTESQIRWALANGFAGLRVDADRETLLNRATSTLSEGSSVVLYTALGP
jgi:uncharacterized protein YgbK (DUF1537 family)